MAAVGALFAMMASQHGGVPHAPRLYLTTRLLMDIGAGIALN